MIGSLTPFYDVLTAQPSLDTSRIERKQMKLAMFAGDGRHYRIDEIRGRHFVQTTERAGLPGAMAIEALEEVAKAAAGAMDAVAKQLPNGFPEEIHASVLRGVTTRLRRI